MAGDRRMRATIIGALSAGILYVSVTIFPIILPGEISFSQRPNEILRDLNWTWTDVFSYVPNAIEICTDLFRTSKDLPSDFQEQYEEFTSYFSSNMHGRVEGYSAKYREEFLVYIKSVQAPFVRTVCETGFNAGHSTFTWLAANPQTHVYSFDIGKHIYSKPMAQYLSEKFPGRLTVTWGDSINTLPHFHETNPDVKCDLIIIDGGHTYDICKSDYDIFKKMANRNNIVILDNYPDRKGHMIHKLGTVWERAKQNGEILEIFKCHDSGHGFSVGRVLVDN